MFMVKNCAICEICVKILLKMSKAFKICQKITKTGGNLFKTVSKITNNCVYSCASVVGVKKQSQCQPSAGSTKLETCPE